MITEALAGAEIAVVGGAYGRHRGRPRSLGALGEVFLGLLLGAAPGIREVRVLGLSREAVGRLSRRLGDRRVTSGTRPARGTAAIVHLGAGGALAAEPVRLEEMLRRADEVVAAARATSRAEVIHVGSVLATGGRLAFGAEAERAFLDRIVRAADRGPAAGAVSGDGPLRWRADGLGFVSAGAWAQAVIEAWLAERLPGDRLTRVRMPLCEPSLALPEPGFCGRSTALAPLVWALGARVGGTRALPCVGDLSVPVLPLDVAAGTLVAIVARAVAVRRASTYALGNAAGAMTWGRVVELTNLARLAMRPPAHAARGWDRIWESFKIAEAEVITPISAPAPSDAPWEPTRAPPSRAVRQVTDRYGALLTRGFPPPEASEVAARVALESALMPSERALLAPPFAWRSYWHGALVPGLAARVFPRFDRRALRRLPEAARGERVR